MRTNLAALLAGFAMLGSVGGVTAETATSSAPPPIILTPGQMDEVSAGGASSLSWTQASQQQQKRVDTYWPLPTTQGVQIMVCEGSNCSTPGMK